ncbi:MAG: hypothetical protein M1819_000630 [Sarea resinae]|nr:MAG: hypothetical protein M1819_000630 [Sarea resinae]
MSGQMAAAGAAADPRLSFEADAIGSYPTRVVEKLHDPSIQFEEYLHYATLTRAEEERLYGAHGIENGTKASPLKVLFGKAPPESTEATVVSGEGIPSEKEIDEKHSVSTPDYKPAVTDEEWYQASRAARTATWGAVFYLITTDILGPFSVPSGYQLWQMFMGLDSDRYPIKNYGDVAFRIYGSFARHSFNVLQSLQFFLNVAILILSNGQALSQLSKKKLCFIVCLLVFTIAGFLLGQIRTLQKFGYVANAAVWMNLFIIFMTMGVVAHSSPNYGAVAASSPAVVTPAQLASGNFTPIHKTGGSPPGLKFTDNITGLMQAVFSYGGATLFCELMAEMRHPWDFWKGLICADLLIYVCYMMFGLFVYSYQGQYSFNPANQGINPYAWQTVGNVFSLISSLIAACMYGNIGIKVLYANVGRDLAGFPVLESHKGKIIFAAAVPIYWAVAWVAGSAIPQISNFSALVGALCILQFTYTFPPFLILGFRAQRDSILPEEAFDPATGTVTRVDSGWKRWMRGLRKTWLLNTWDFIYMLGAATTAVLGIYASIVQMKDAYESNPAQVAFSCKPPV